MLGDHIYASLNELRGRLPLLDEALAGGTPRRWTERDLTDAQRERLDAQAFQDRAARAWNTRHGRTTALGDSRAPLALNVLDTVTAIGSGVIAIEKATCEWLGITPLVDAGTGQRITRIIGLIRRIEALEELAIYVDAESARLNRWAGSAIGDTEPVHKIKARCPICDAKSLRAFPHRELVICVNANCVCDQQDCRCTADRPLRHRWPYDQWPWLAQVLNEELTPKQEAS